MDATAGRLLGAKDSATGPASESSATGETIPKAILTELNESLQEKEWRNIYSQPTATLVSRVFPSSFSITRIEVSTSRTQ